MIYKLEDIKDDLEHFRKHGLPKGFSTGWKEMDTLYRPEPNYFTLVTGIPSHGKTQWLNALQVNLSLIHGWKHANFSPESFPLAAYYNEFMQILSGKNLQSVSTQKYDAYRDWVDEHFHFIYPKEGEKDIDSLLGYVKDSLAGWGCNTFVLDPWNEIEYELSSGMTETRFISVTLTKIREFCRDNHVHGYIVAHPTKMQKDKDGNYMIPTGYDVAGSAHFYNKLDFIITVHRHDLTQNEPTVYVQKVKFKNLGKIGANKMCYDWKTGRISENFTDFRLHGES